MKPQSTIRKEPSVSAARCGFALKLGLSCASLGLAACNATFEEMDEAQEDAIGSADAEIINGSTSLNWYHADRTVHVRTPGGGTCSGTLVLPNVVLTARHCVTTDGTIGGTIATPTQVRARVRALAPAPATPDLCTGASRVESCARASSISNLGGATSDGVLMQLENPIDGSGTAFPTFTPIEIRGNDDDFLGWNVLQTGWGRNTCSGGTGVLRQGQNVITAVDQNAVVDGTTHFNLIQFEPVSSQRFWKGDSGGPTWGSGVVPDAVIGVHSVGTCGTSSGNNFDWSVHTHRESLRNILTTMTPASITRTLGNSAELTFPTPTGWQIVSGKLKQTQNVGASVVALAGLAFQRLVDLQFTVDVQGSDNDQSGLAFHYVPRFDSYVRCEASEQSQEVRLVARVLGTDQVLSSAPWSGDYGQTVSFRVRTVRNASTGRSTISCRASGGGASAVTVTSTWDGLVAGMVGVYNEANDETSYSNFVVTRL